MQYFSDLANQDEVFFIKPEKINGHDRDLLQYALGATLYMPGTRKTIAKDFIAGKLSRLGSAVICLEDAISDLSIDEAEKNIAKNFAEIGAAVRDGRLIELPFLFIRIREASQMHRLAELMGDNLRYLTGFVFPKFTYKHGASFLDELVKLNHTYKTSLYGMPILESKEVFKIDTRTECLIRTKNLLGCFREYILNVRMGATDLSGLIGVRRSPEFTVYDIAPIRDCISDIINVFMGDYVVSGPVWEYFSTNDRILKPQLRTTPFNDLSASALRNAFLWRYIDGLIREVMYDKTNGLVGKTIIHPSHIAPVLALQVVTHEEYMDALSILDANGGAIKSQYQNKMNEVKPHTLWAQKILTKSKIYGVYHENKNFINLLAKIYKWSCHFS